MAFVFEMPEVGEGVVEAEVTEWKVAVGDRVRVDQPLCEITTDKASLEISSPKAGVIQRLHAGPGDIVKVHAPLADIALDDAPAAAAPATARATAPPPPASPRSVEPAPPAPDPATRADVKAAPAVRRHARELGLDIGQVPGSGPGGRVSHGDLEAYASRPAPTASTAPTAAPPVLPLIPVALPPVRPSGSVERVKLVGVRRKIAERMQAAKRTAAHFTYVEEIDCTRLVAFRERLKGPAAARGVKLTFMPFFGKACSVAFRDFPNLNATMDEAAGELVVHADHHIGFACDTPSGLMVPVLRHVEQRSILQMAAELQGLFERARAGRSGRDELSGSTFSITSVGNIGGVLATPILNVPEVAILGVNQIRKRAVVDEEDRVVVRPMTYLSSSFDHRIIDGAVAARFIARVKELLESPETLLLELA